MNTNKILANFQFLDNKVVDFCINNSLTNIRDKTIKIDYDIDYEIISCDEIKNSYLGVIDFIVNLAGIIEDEKSFEINLTIRGRFTGDKDKITIDRFKEMLRLNGTATLSQIARAYINSVTSLSGMIPINLPMVNIHSMKSYKEEISNNKSEN